VETAIELTIPGGMLLGQYYYPLLVTIGIKGIKTLKLKIGDLCIIKFKLNPGFLFVIAPTH